MKKGHLITFEGGEGVGKDTQVDMFRDRLKKEGYDISDIELYEPGSTKVGDVCRILVKNSVDKDHISHLTNVYDHIKDQEITPFTQTCLFMASRAEIYDKIIKPELEQGKIVVLNRSIDSTTAYQGHAQNPDLIPLIRSMNEEALDDVKISMTFLLDLDVVTSQERMSARDGDEGDRFQDMKLDFHEKIRSGYLSEAKHDPNRIKVIDAAPSKETIHEDIFKEFLSCLEADK